MPAEVLLTARPSRTLLLSVSLPLLSLPLSPQRCWTVSPQRAASLWSSLCHVFLSFISLLISPLHARNHLGLS
jgi:hypothetical protein